MRTVDVVLAGATGRVGRAFRSQLSDAATRLRREEGVDVRVTAGFGRNRHYLAPPLSRETRAAEGRTIQGALDEMRKGEPILVSGTLTGRDVLSILRGSTADTRIFVDCTADAHVPEIYPDVVEAGASVVAANKSGWVRPLDEWRTLRQQAASRGASLRYETTVGATLPMLGPVRELRRAGDSLVSLQAVLSGTLAFVLSRIRAGIPLSSAVAEARKAGYTEPHPGDDLDGMDVARKLVILTREWGLPTELDLVSLEPFVNARILAEPDPDRFVDRLAELDEEWERTAERARNEGRVLVYMADAGEPAEGAGAGHAPLRLRVGLRELPEDHPLARLQATENMAIMRTRRFSPVPLTICGPGAGVDLTAAGVLADLLSLVPSNYRNSPSSSP